MSSRRHSRGGSGRRSGKKTTKLAQSNNVMLLKLVDPIAQSLLIIFFMYCIDAEKLFSYRSVLFILVVWQMVSVFFNFFLGELKLLKGQRLLFFCIMAAYMTFFVFYEKTTKVHLISIDEASRATLPLDRIVIMSIAIILAFWYNIICYREIRTLLAGVVNRGRE